MLRDAGRPLHLEFTPGRASSPTRAQALGTLDALGPRGSPPPTRASALRTLDSLGPPLARPVAVLAYGTTGDGALDAFDTNQVRRADFKVFKVL